MVYLISNKKLPRSGISFVTTESKAQTIAHKAAEKSGKKIHIYKVSAPKKRR